MRPQLQLRTPRKITPIVPGVAVRAFSWPTADALARALADWDPDKSGTDEAIVLVMLQAAMEARQKGWSPAQMLGALKPAALSGRPREEGTTLFQLLSRRALIAYYGQQEIAG